MALYGNLKANNLIYNLDDGAGDITVSLSQVGDKAPIASPTFTGTVTIPAGASISGFAPLASPVLTGTPTVPGYMPLAGGTFTGDLQIDNAKKFILSETDANGSNYLSFRVPDALTNTVDFVLPHGDGGQANQPLVTSGSGVLSWGTTLDAFAPLNNPALTGTATAVNLTISGDLTVNGTTTEVNSTTLTVDDKNIELGKGTGSATTGQSATLATGTNDVTVASTVGYLPGAALINLGGSGAFGSATPFVKSITSSTVFTVGDGAGNVLNHTGAGAVTFDVGPASDITADGGGITLKGSTDKTILWTNSTDSWDFNQDIKTSGTVTDSKGDLRKIPQESDRANLATDHVLVANDAGQHLVFQPTADYVAGSAGTKVTVNDSVFSAGDAVTIVNNSAYTLFIEKGTASVYWTSDGTDASRTLAARGMATILFLSSGNSYISGAGLS